MQFHVRHLVSTMGKAYAFRLPWAEGSQGEKENSTSLRAGPDAASLSDTKCKKKMEVFTDAHTIRKGLRTAGHSHGKAYIPWSVRPDIDWPYGSYHKSKN